MEAATRPLAMLLGLLVVRPAKIRIKNIDETRGIIEAVYIECYACSSHRSSIAGAKSVLLSITVQDQNCKPVKMTNTDVIVQVTSGLNSCILYMCEVILVRLLPYHLEGRFSCSTAGDGLSIMLS